MTDLRTALHNAVDRDVTARSRPALDRSDLQARIERRRQTKRRRFGVVAVAAVMAVAGLAVWATAGRSDDRSTNVNAGRTGANIDSASGRWSRLPDAPLTPRTGAGVFWTGREVLVVGGSDGLPCPENASCASGPPPLRDGAAYDPATERWRSMAPLPIGLAFPAGAVVDGDLYLLGSDPIVEGASGEQGEEEHLLRYQPEADSWTELPRPPGEPFRSLVADGDHLVAYLPSHESGHDEADQLWDPGTATWTALPRDPLAPSFDRTVVSVDGRLYIFAKDLVANPGADGPALVRGAVFDGTTWSELPPSEAIGYGAFAVDGVILNTESGSADGGEVGNWGRSYPNRWLYDPASSRWEDIPGAPPSADVRSFTDWQPIVGTAGAGSTTPGTGLVISGDAVFDVDRRTWSSLDPPAALDRREMGGTWADDRLVVFGGVTVTEPYVDSTLQADLWQWVPAG